MWQGFTWIPSFVVHICLLNRWWMSYTFLTVATVTTVAFNILKYLIFTCESKAWHLKCQVLFSLIFFFFFFFCRIHLLQFQSPKVSCESKAWHFMWIIYDDSHEMSSLIFSEFFFFFFRIHLLQFQSPEVSCFFFLEYICYNFSHLKSPVLEILN